MTNDTNMCEKLDDIWGALTLTPGDDAAIEKQHEVLPVVATWLADGKNDPEIVIRAVQLLLADPEYPELRQRACWKTLRKKLIEVWKAAGTGDKPFFYVQALLLAAWPQDAEGHFLLKPLLDSAWALQDRRTLKALAEWRNATAPKLVSGEVASTTRPDPATSNSTGLPRSDFDLKTAADIAHIEENKGHGHVERIGFQLSSVLKAHDAALVNLSAVKPTFAEANARLTALTGIAHQLTQNDDLLIKNVTQNNLLWWGQSRYCRTLGKPYRRLKSDKPALLWWTAREAAEFAQSVEVEPAAAYLVQTLQDLGQDVDEEKPVLDWMKELHGALMQGADNVPRLSKRLDEIAGADALGLPVTWVRRKAMLKEPFSEDDAKNDVALPLDKTIDRGDWASWIFRETLLDLHLAEKQ